MIFTLGLGCSRTQVRLFRVAKVQITSSISSYRIFYALVVSVTNFGRNCCHELYCFRGRNEKSWYSTNLSAYL